MHLVMFDIDGTLVQSFQFDGDLYSQAVSESLNISISTNWEEYTNVTDSGILDEIIDKNRLSKDRTSIHQKVKQRFVQLMSEYLTEHPEVAKEVRGAHFFIDTLKSRKDVQVAFATGGWKETAEFKLKAIGIDTNGFALASSSDTTRRVDIMKMAEKRAKTNETFLEKTYFGDGIWDKKASAELGYHFIAVGNNVEHHAQIDNFLDHESTLKLIGLS